MDRKTFLKKTPILGLTATIALTSCSTGATSTDIDLTGDAEILTLAAIREDQAINTYQAIIDSERFTSQTIIDTLELFKSHHTEHLAIFNSLLEELEVGSIVPGSEGEAEGFSLSISDTEILTFAMNLELNAAQAYFTDAFQQLQGLNAKQTMGEIYPVELAHFLSLKETLEITPVINAAVFTEINANS